MVRVANKNKNTLLTTELADDDELTVLAVYKFFR